MRKLARRVALAAALLAGAMLLALGGLYWATRQVPDFYRQSLARPGGDEPASGERFEQQALALHNQLQHAGKWSVRFTQDEINDWLANDLPQKFPRLLPAGVSEPRVAIDGTAVRLAVRYSRGNVETVLSIAGEVYLTDQANEIAIRIGQARAGFLPVPLARVLDDVRERAAWAHVPVRWTESDGAPVALVRVPSEAAVSESDESQPQQLILEQLRLSPGELVAAGRIETTSADVHESPPTTAIQPGENETRQR